MFTDKLKIYVRAIIVKNDKINEILGPNFLSE
jgi:hypothetical protein